MSLMICPDCGHEVSTGATACPNCAHPFVLPNAPTPRTVIVDNTPDRESGIPTWAYVLFGILGVCLLFGVIFLVKQNNDDAANRTVELDVRGKQSSNSSKEVTRTPTQTVSVPAATDSQTVSVPATTSTNSTTSTIDTATTGTKTVVSDKGSVLIDAKIVNAKSAVQSVKAEKFYLLDDSLEEILSDANLEPIDGQSLINSFGLSVLYPSRYSEFNKNALSAIKSHIKYDVLTDSNGKAQMKEVKPDSYYLFGVTKSGNAFAVWNSPITIQTGENVLSLSPQRLTEVEKESEEEEE